MDRFSIGGAPFEIGEALGRIGRALAGQIFQCVQSDAFCSQLRGTGMSARLERACDSFPELWEELRGMSAGLGLDITEVFLWNCLQERLAFPHAASSSIVINRLGYRLVLNKRALGFPLAGQCRMVEVRPEGKPGYLGLYIPGCLPGATFAANYAGVAQAVDPVPQDAPGEGLPGFLISRAVLDAASLADAVDVVMACDRLDAAYHILASTQEFVTVVIAAAPAQRTIAPIANRYWHTNHWLDKAAAGKPDSRPSSLRRYAELSDLMRRLPDHPAEEDMLALLEAEGMPDASAVRPAQGDIGTALIKLAPGRIDLRLFGPAGAVIHHDVMAIS